MSSTASPTDPIDVVQQFLGAMERFDLDAMLALVDEEIVYQNVPFPPARGVRQFRGQMETFARYADVFEVEMHNIAADGPVVLTERTDLLGKGRVRPALWVCGTFEVRNGKIVLWRDRFDFANLAAALVRSLAGAGLSLLRRN